MYCPVKVARRSELVGNDNTLGTLAVGRCTESVLAGATGLRTGREVWALSFVFAF